MSIATNAIYYHVFTTIVMFEHYVIDQIKAAWPNIEQFYGIWGHYDVS